MDERLGRKRLVRTQKPTVRSVSLEDLALLEQCATPEEKESLKWSADSLGHGSRVRRMIKRIKVRLQAANS